MALPFNIGSRLLDLGARKMGQAFGLKPQPKPESSADWSARLGAIRTAAQDAATAKKPTIATAKPVNPAASSVKPAMSVKPPPAIPAPSSPFSQPGVIGGFEGPKLMPINGGINLNPEDVPGHFGQLPSSQTSSQKQPETELKNWDPFATVSDRETVERLRGTAESPLQKSQREYLDSLTPSADVTAAQGQLGAIEAKLAADKAAKEQEYAQRVGAIQEQATLQPFLTGRQLQASEQLANQLGALKSGAEAQTIPLAQRLASFQEQQKARQAAAEARLKFATPEKPVEVGGRLVDPSTGRVVYEAPADARDKKYETVAPGASLVDPETGKVIFAAPGASTDKTTTLSPGQRMYDPQGKLIAENPASSGTEKTISVSPGATVIDSQGNVIYRAPAVPKPLTAEQAKNQGFVLRVEDSMRLIDQFGGAAAGIGGAAQSLVPGGPLTNFLRTPEYQQLDQAQRDFVNAILRRESGAVISKEEFANAKLQYFPQPGDDAATLEQKRANRQNALEGLKISSGQTGVEQRNTFVDPSGTEFEQGDDGLYYPKSEGGSAAAGTPADAKRVANAIGQFESGGNYRALGPVLNSGSYRGDRAYGKYQVMGKNVPSWTKEALGVAMTPQQFLNDPKAQDAVAEHRMGKLIAQGYGVEDIASIWFSGRPLAKAGAAKDQLGTTVPQYARNVRAIYNRS